MTGLSDKQVIAIDRSTARVNILEGAVRSGKSIAADFKWFDFVAKAPKTGELVIMGRTQDTIERNVVNVLQQQPLFGKLAKAVAHTKGSNTARILGREVHLLGANDVASETRVRGMTLAGALVDEATIIPEVTFKQLVARMSVVGAQLFATTNPDSPNHWLKKEWIDPHDPDVRTFHFDLDDNLALDPGYVAYLRRQYTGLWRKRFIDGLWVLAEGAIFDQFDHDVHTIDPADVPFITRWLVVGVDYGTTNPFHCVLIGVGVDKRLYVVSEYRHDSRSTHRQMTDAEYSAAFRAWLPTVPIPGTEFTGVEVEYVVVDPSAASFRAQMIQDGVSSYTADNEVLDGIRVVSQLLSNGQLIISRACPHLIAEMPAYSWDPKAQLLGEDKPIKLNDHGIDALRYALFTTRNAWQGTLALAA